MVRIVGVVLIILGTLGMVYQGFSYVTRERVVDAGPIQVSADRERFVWVPPVVSGVAIAGGLALVVLGGRKTA